MIPRPPATLTRHELNQTPTPCRGSQAPTMFVQVPFAFASRPTTASIQASKASKATSTIKDRHLNHHHHQWAVRAKETYPAMHRPAVPQQHKSGSLPCPGMTGAKTLTEHVKAQHLPPEQCRRNDGSCPYRCVHTASQLPPPNWNPVLFTLPAPPVPLTGWITRR